MSAQKSYLGATSETIIEKVDDFVKNKRDCLLRIGTNDVTNGIDTLNSVKKIVKKVKENSPNIRIRFFEPNLT